MFIQKIGNKAAAFLNHKPFHPGNIRNLEKVWIAEEKQNEIEKKQLELQNKRKKEWEIETLRRTLKNIRSETYEQEGYLEIKNSNYNNEYGYQIRTLNNSSIVQELPVRYNLYHEDILINGHSRIWGSWYDRKLNKWGYSCCKQTIKSCKCLTNYTLDNIQNNKNIRDNIIRKRNTSNNSITYSRNNGISDFFQALKRERNE
ncbi:uncharacterized protein CMU_033160 [Cryptosporidium muris RN66]|uniref:CBF1-interacting co-repressor CIR N-terminal domain-containing protein n=1 Tax=Cryptosporidium muris (strain RN66) TaxID=441375 RepID=B6AFE0_CRYMR|nr:uncharacterized protein CMU_033160 [Cryptosporidium muris RN66]EEA06931.1 hypothetical protein, conserved [Cryptosporidium muris RN66]|eukprot:XP_002141280.1 hypothetical protein [Cryptosporidium muris RN66]